MYKQYQPPTPSFLVINFSPPLLSYHIRSTPLPTSLYSYRIQRESEKTLLPNRNASQTRSPNETIFQNWRTNPESLFIQIRLLSSLPHGPLTYFSETWFSQENLISSFAKTIIPADNGGTREVGKGVGWTDAVI